MSRSSVLFICKDTGENRFLAEQAALRDECDVVFLATAKDGLKAFRKNGADVVVADISLPDARGFNVIKEIKEADKESIVIVIMDKQALEVEQAHHGIFETISRPVEPEQLLFAIKRGVEVRRGLAAYQKAIQSLQERNVSLEKQNILLTQRIEDSTRNLTRLYENLRATYLHTIKVLAQAIDARDHFTHSHSENVVKYATAIARELGLSAKETETIADACQLHDLGKIGIGDSILGKVTALTDDEWRQIRRHPVTGAQILQPLTFLREVIELVRQHHEHYDGTGYPDGRRGEDIPLGARVIHLADAYEAMRSARSYRKIPLSKEAALQEVKRHSGTQFDPRIVEVFLLVVDKIDPDVANV